MEPTIPITLVGKSGSWTTVVATIDTGFSAFLSLPKALIESLELTRTDSEDFILADGVSREFQVFEGAVLLGEEPTELPVVAIESEPLVGMGLLQGYRISLNVVVDGLVEVEQISV